MQGDQEEKKKIDEFDNIQDQVRPEGVERVEREREGLIGRGAEGTLYEG